MLLLVRLRLRLCGAGGGLCGGIAIAIKALWPSIKVIAAEPAAADDAFRSKLTGELQPHRYPDHSVLLTAAAGVDMRMKSQWQW